MLDVKKTITKILNALQGKTGLPDYSNATAFSFSWDTNITIANDGYIVATMSTSQNGALMRATVNDVMVWAVAGGTNNARYYTGMFPVCKGDIVRFTSAYTVTGTAQFIPYK